MNEERKKILHKVNELIEKKTNKLLQKLPDVHEIDDGVVIRFFTEWDNCDDNVKIRYKKFSNEKNPDEKLVFFFLPKGALISLMKRDFIKTITCFSGELELNINNTVRYLSSYNKIHLNTDTFMGKALEDTYVLTSSL